MRAQWHACAHAHAARTSRTHRHIHTVSVVFAEHFPLAADYGSARARVKSEKNTHTPYAGKRKTCTLCQYFSTFLPLIPLLPLFFLFYFFFFFGVISFWYFTMEVRVHKNMFCICGILKTNENLKKIFSYAFVRFVRQLILHFCFFSFSSSKTSYTFFTMSDSKIRLATKTFCLYSFCSVAVADAVVLVLLFHHDLRRHYHHHCRSRRRSRRLLSAF